MLIRKFYAYLLTSTILIPIMTLILLTTSDIPLSILIPIVGLYVLGGLFSFGVPTSVLSDVLTEKASPDKRSKLALILHTLFGMSFIFVLGLLADANSLFNDFAVFWSSMYLFFFSATLAAILFWTFDEWVRKKRGR
ncbi:hypothetical protein [Alkalibacillus silvisoli]|uniref:MFS transporter n=1 Tax=Alkalibacillus silvisoli TaxID=392823 RepID=A0ABN0ZLG2_9BACI